MRGNPMKIEVEILPIEDAQKDGEEIVAYVPGITPPWMSVWWYEKRSEWRLGDYPIGRPTHYIKGLPETLEGKE